MERQIDSFLKKISRGLQLTEADKTDIVEEIRNHIYEAVNRQESVERVLQRLGDPQKLAQSYNHTYKLERQEFRLSDMLNGFAFYSSVALSGLFVMTILPVLSISFIFTAFALIGVSITNFIGFTALPFNLGLMPVTGVWQIVIAVVVGGILFLIAWVCWAGLKKYIQSVSSNYHRRRMGSTR